MSRRHLLPIMTLALAGASLACADTQIPGEFNVQTTTQGNIEEVIDRLVGQLERHVALLLLRRG